MAARSQLRRRRGATAALALLVGLAGAVVIAALAGASRTDTAMKRFVTFSRPEDLVAIVNGAQGDPSDPAVMARGLTTRARVLRLPQVAQVARAPYLLMSADRAGQQVNDLSTFGVADDHAFRSIDRTLLLHGRLAQPGRADEAVVDDLAAARRNLHVGSQLTMWGFSSRQANDIFQVAGFGKYPVPEGPSYSFRVVGIVRLATAVDSPPASIVHDADFKGSGTMIVTSAFLQRFAADLGLPTEALPGMEDFRVRLRHGLADLTAFQEGVRQSVSPGDGQVHIGSDIQTAADKAQRAIHLEAFALVLFAVVAALAALLVLGQALSRQVAADAADNPTLASLGLSRRQLTLVPLVRASLIGVAGATVAVIVAVALSPLAPIGLARRAEIHPGVSLNVAVLALGFVGVALLTVLRSLVPAWRIARTLPADNLEQAPARPGPLRAVVIRSGLGPSAVAGVGMSFERGRGIAVRAALLGALVAVMAAVAAVTFGVSLQHLVDTPVQQGWNWDVVVGNPNSQPALMGDPIAGSLHEEMTRRLSTNKHVGTFSGLALGDAITIDGHLVEIAGIDPANGSVFPPIVQGRPPNADDEIVLGRDVLTQIHKQIGQRVTMGAGPRHLSMNIVGQSLQPTAGDLSARLSRGGVVTMAGFERLLPGTPVLQFLVRYRPGTDRRAAFVSLLDDFGREILRPYPGGEVGDLARVDFLPYVLAGLLVVLAVGGLALTLVSSVRNHRRDLAVLKTLGFLRRQVSATVAWQATTVAVGAIVVGLPCGLALGRWTWRLVARSIGSVAPPVVPLGAVLLIVPATVLIANLLAGGPSWTAGRVKPAEALRSE